VTERLHIAGYSGGELFTTDAIEALNRYSHGIPRIINLLAEHSLITAFVEQHKVISEKIVQEVARDFYLQEGVAPGAATAAKVPASSGSHPMLVDSLPSGQRPATGSFSKAAGEKKT
jgi:hypothetical protein